MIETTCACGKLFQVPDDLAGRRARCKACGAIVTLLAASLPVARHVDEPGIVMQCRCGKRLAVSRDLVGTQVACPGCQAVLAVPCENSMAGSQDYAMSVDAGGGYDIASDDFAGDPMNEAVFKRTARRHSPRTALVVGNDYIPSNPGNLIVCLPKYWMAYPLWPSVWTGGLAFFLVMTFTIHYVWMAGAFAFGAMAIYYWILIFEHFRHGPVCPGIVLSEERQLVAVYSDLSMRHGQSYPHIRVLRQPLHLACVPVHAGARVATSALYRGWPEEKGRWENFYPKVVACAVLSSRTANRILDSVPMEEWEMLLCGIEQLNTPYKPGLYKISQYY